MEQGIEAAALHVPLLWLVSSIVVLGGSFITLIGWWLAREMRRNDKEHDALKRQIDRLVRRIDYMILRIDPASPMYRDDIDDRD